MQIYNKKLKHIFFKAGSEILIQKFKYLYCLKKIVKI